MSRAVTIRKATRRLFLPLQYGTRLMARVTPRSPIVRNVALIVAAAIIFIALQQSSVPPLTSMKVGLDIVAAPVHHNRTQPESIKVGSTTSIRLMMVGDSITEGMAPQHSQHRALAPSEGSCSYRFELIRALQAALSPHLTLDVVGPFVGHVGSDVSTAACTHGLTTAGYSRHAAIWGVTVKEIIGMEPLDKKRRFARRHYFGKRYRNALPDSTGTNPQRTSHASRWSRMLVPNLVTVLIGTNDLAQGALADTMVVERLPLLLHSLLPLDDHLTSGTCVRRVAIATLLPRALPNQLLVEDVNQWLGRIQTCKAQSLNQQHQCVDCVAQTTIPAFMNEVLPSNTSRLKVPRYQHSDKSVTLAAERWCSRCVYVLNISRPTMVDASREYMYDGLHPNRAGDERVGRLMIAELLAVGALDGWLR